jgi:hypothetical protein
MLLMIHIHIAFPQWVILAVYNDIGNEHVEVEIMLVNIEAKIMCSTTPETSDFFTSTKVGQWAAPTT